MKVAAVVLAAGASTRLREPKQLVELAGERLLERAIRIAAESGCEPVIVVLGAHADEIRAACRLDGADVVVNPDWEQGMASSVRAGLLQVPPLCEGLLLMTCDQPAVKAGHLARLIAAGEEQRQGYAVGSGYAGKVGVPAYFPARLFGELSALRGDQGARVLLTRSSAVDLPDGELDIDTIELLVEARRRFW